MEYNDYLKIKPLLVKAQVLSPAQPAPSGKHSNHSIPAQAPNPNQGSPGLLPAPGPGSHQAATQHRSPQPRFPPGSQLGTRLQQHQKLKKPVLTTSNHLSNPARPQQLAQTLPQPRAVKSPSSSQPQAHPTSNHHRSFPCREAGGSCPGEIGGS